jgi:hypothetical protein
MHFLIDAQNKVIFGWSPKCGCSHVIKLFNFLTNRPNKPIHERDDNNKLPANFNQFTIFLFIRNPYERIISGFVEKYAENGHFNHLWNKKIPLTFRNFVVALSRYNFKMIDLHHFAPQLSGKWSESLKTHKNLTIYDITNINYSNLEQIYNKKIPTSVLKFRGGHENVNVNDVECDVYDMRIEEFAGCKPLTARFYNEYIAKTIETMYKNDLDYFNSVGFNYLNPLLNVPPNPIANPTIKPLSLATPMTPLNINAPMNLLNIGTNFKPISLTPAPAPAPM